MLPTSSNLAKKACLGAQVGACAAAHPAPPGHRPVIPRECAHHFVLQGEIDRTPGERQHYEPAIAGRRSARTIPTMALKINARAAYIMPPACGVPRDEFRCFQVSPAGAGKFIAAQGWQLP